MPTPRQIEKLLIDEEIARRKALREFNYFVKLCWHVVEPTLPYESTFAVEAIGQHLEAALKFEFGELVIVIPPRMSKTVLSGIFFPAWVWAKGGNYCGLKFMFSSLSSQLTVETSIRCRRLIESDFYQRFFKPEFKLNSDGGNRQDFFSNDKGGYRVSTSVGASATGRGADVLICDDLLRALDSDNANEKKTVTNYYKQELITRAISPKRFVKIIICQRLAPDDLPGTILSGRSPKTVLLKFPMEFEGDKTPNALGWVDPRNEIGELLAPNRITHTELAEIKTSLGTRAYNAQYQQNPSAIEGAVIKRSWFKYYNSQALPWDLTQHTASWDFATSEKTSADYTVGMVGARKGAQIYLLDMLRARMEFPEAVQAFKAFSAKHSKAVRKLVEDKSAGTQIIQVLKQQVQGIVPVQPKGDKLTRLLRVAPLIEAGNVYLPEGAPWVHDFLDEVCSFAGEGSVKHDDTVDSCGQLLFSFIETPPPVAPTSVGTPGTGRKHSGY